MHFVERPLFIYVNLRDENKKGRVVWVLADEVDIPPTFMQQAAE